MWPRIGQLPTYGVCYIIGFFFYFIIGWRLAKRLGLRRRIWIITGLCYVFGMTIGAKILFNIQKSMFDFSALFTMKHYTQGGLWGGLLAYFCLSVPIVLLLSKRKQAALDLVAMSVPVPWIFAKLGCLFNGCCYGKPCTLPWAITFPEGARSNVPAGVPLHPTQIYEIFLMIIIIVVFIILRSQKWRGTKLFLFLAIYGIGRAFIEFFRGDFEQHRYIGSLTLSQLLCIIAAGISIIILIIKFKLSRKAHINTNEI